VLLLILSTCGCTSGSKSAIHDEVAIHVAGSIGLLKSDGRIVKLVAPAPGFWTYDAQLSPDRAKLLYCRFSEKAGTSSLIIRDLKTSAENELATFNWPQVIGSPYWSPDNDRLAFFTREYVGVPGVPKLWLARISDKKKVMSATNRIPICWTSAKELIAEDAYSEKVFRLKVDSSNSVYEERLLSLPPSGLRIGGSSGSTILVYQPASLGTYPVYLFNTETGEVRYITEAPMEVMNFVPTGDNSLLATTYRNTALGVPQDTAVWAFAHGKWKLIAKNAMLGGGSESAYSISTVIQLLQQKEGRLQRSP
jgi:hypothetical protein